LTQHRHGPLEWILAACVLLFAALPVGPAHASTGSLTDTTVADFSAGSPSANTYVAETVDGELMLNPAAGVEFYGSAIPPGWSVAAVESGGGAVVQDGTLQADGARVSDDFSYGPGRSVEFVATFGEAEAQSAGFADLSALDGARWTMFTTLDTTTDLYASSDAGVGDAVETLISGSFLGTPHRYRIDWNLASVDFIVDGALVASHPVAPAFSMPPFATDGHVGGETLALDWLRVTPYAAAGSFESRVLDAGRGVDWDALSWTSQSPAGTAITVSARTGDTAVPDGSWTSFSALAASGDPVDGSSRYLQYRAELTSADPGQTPSLEDVSVSYTDATAPAVQIDDVSDSLLAAGDTGTDVTWHADEDGTYSVRVGGDGCTTGDEVEGGSYTGAPAQHTTDLAAGDLEEGANTIRVCVTDQAGNEGSETTSVVKDTTAPTVTVDALSDSLIGASDTGTDVTWHADEDGVVSVRVGLAGWPFSQATSCLAGTVVDSGGYTGAPAQRTTTVSASDLRTTLNPIHVCLTDTAGNMASEAVYVIKDLSGPTVTVDSLSHTVVGPSHPDTDVRWRANDGGPYTVRVGGTSCATGTAVASGHYVTAPMQTSTTVNASDLVEGSNTIRVCVDDVFGNEGAATISVVLDATGPTVGIDAVSDDVIGPAAPASDITWQASESGTYSVRVAGSSCATGTQVAGGSYAGAPEQVTTTVTTDDLSEGANTIRICVTDEVGNQASLTTSIGKDTTAPTVAVDTVSDSMIGPEDSDTDVTWHANENGAYAMRVSGAGCTTGNSVENGNYTDAPAPRTTTVSTGDLSQGANTIRVCVTDATGNQGSATTTVLKDTAERTTFTFGPQADARVEEANPDTNFGTSSALRVEAGSALDIESYLRFQIVGLLGAVEHATLRLWVTNGTTNGPAAYTTNWTGAETAITWNNRPPGTSGPTDDKGSIPAGAFIDYDVTPLVTGNGTHAFLLAGTSSDSLGISSRESSTASQRPQLIVTAIAEGTDSEPPTAPTGLTAAAHWPTQVSLNWTAATDNIGVTAYRIYRDGALLTAVGDVTTYTDTTAHANTAYEYEVRALDTAGNLSAPSNDAEVTTPPPATDPVIMAAGDQACDPTASAFNSGLGTATSCRQKYTSDLLVNQDLAAVLALGDIQYECSGFSAFLQAYDPTWGRVKSITHPVPGNHEYHTEGGTDCDPTGTAQGYFNYFGAAAGDAAKGYYSFDIGAWHLVALNSNCAQVSCAASSAQANWLRQDLAANPRVCTLAFWHHPRFTSGTNSPGSLSVKPLYQALYDYKADLVLVGHDHDYERFALKDPEGALDPVIGIREFVVGTGGKSFHNWGAVQPGSEARNNDTFGVLKLILGSTSYEWRFVPEAGKTYTDTGTAPCSV
jgi:hypothetical protein